MVWLGADKLGTDRDTNNFPQVCVLDLK